MDYANHASRPTLKHSYQNMAQAGAPPPFLDYSGASRAPHDDHYHNPEHQSQRRRMEEPWHQRPVQQQRYPGDGFDFRRPIMSASNMIDLTEESQEGSFPQPHLVLPVAPDTAAAGSSASDSRAQRLPRFQRDIIDLADSDEEEPQEPPAQRPANSLQLPAHSSMRRVENLFMPQMEEDEDSLFIPQVPTRPPTAGLRRPGYPRRPTPAIDLDDVEIVSSRPLSRNPSRRATPAVFMPGQIAPQNPPNNASTTIDLTADDDDEVIHTNTRPLPSINGDRPAMAGSGIGTRDRPPGGDFGIGRLVQRFRGQNAMAANFLDRYANMNYGNNEDAAARAHAAQDIARRRVREARARTIELEEQLQRAQQQMSGYHGRRPRPAAMPAIRMDYGMVGFDLGMGMGVVEPATPKYEPPPPVAKGFTRNPEEDEEVVCPNCGDELAVGKDETKQQVWVVKHCGHAYCGECATRSRPTSTSKKGKGRAVDPSIPPPLKKCVVVGCEKPATKKDMIHVYMSS